MAVGGDEASEETKRALKTLTEMFTNVDEEKIKATLTQVEGIFGDCIGSADMLIEQSVAIILDELNDENEETNSSANYSSDSLLSKDEEKIKTTSKSNNDTQETVSKKKILTINPSSDVPVIDSSKKVPLLDAASDDWNEFTLSDENEESLETDNNACNISFIKYLFPVKESTGIKKKSCTKHPAKNRYNCNKDSVSLMIETPDNTESSDLEEIPEISCPNKTDEVQSSKSITDHIVTLHSQQGESSKSNILTQQLKSSSIESEVFQAADKNLEIPGTALTNLTEEYHSIGSNSTFLSAEGEENICLLDDNSTNQLASSNIDKVNIDDVEKINLVTYKDGQRATVTITTESSTQTCDSQIAQAGINAFITYENGSINQDRKCQNKRRLSPKQLKDILNSVESKLMLMDISQPGRSSLQTDSSSHSGISKRVITEDDCPSPTKRQRTEEHHDSKSYRDVEQYSFNTESNILRTNSSLMVCEGCNSTVKVDNLCQCDLAHIICQNCLEEEVRIVMNTEKFHMTCPVEGCGSVINIDILQNLLPPLVIDLIIENTRRKELQASNTAIHRMKGIMTCPRCSSKVLMDDDDVWFVCANNCDVKCCRYCYGTMLFSDEDKQHKFCVMLSFVGIECLSDITVMPDNWSSIASTKVSIDLNSNEGKAIADFFSKTISHEPVKRVKRLWRNQNKKLWERYILKRMHIKDEIHSSGFGFDLKEKYLFHGTSQDNIDKIRSEGFDMRMPVRNGAAYGEGIYFSTRADYSIKYSLGYKSMFLARVVCGMSAQGRSGYKRPPKGPKRFFDSCVDKLRDPLIYIIFDNSQVYPEILIEFD